MSTALVVAGVSVAVLAFVVGCLVGAGVTRRRMEDDATLRAHVQRTYAR